MTTLLVHNWSGELVRFSLRSGDYVTPLVTVPPSTLASFPYYYTDDLLSPPIQVQYGGVEYSLPDPETGVRQGYLGWLCDPGIGIGGGDTQTYSPAGYRVSEAYLVWRDQYSAASANIVSRPRDLYIALPSRTTAQLEQMTEVPTLGAAAIVRRDLAQVGSTPPSTGLWNISGQQITLGDQEIGLWWVVVGLGILVACILIVSVLVAVYTSRATASRQVRDGEIGPCVC